MKKRFSLMCVGLLLSMLLIFAGCGEGKGAEDTGGDGKVGDKSKSTTSTSSTSGSNNATTSTTASTPQTAGTSGNGMMDDARDLVEDVLPGSQGDRKIP